MNFWKKKKSERQTFPSFPQNRWLLSVQAFPGGYGQERFKSHWFSMLVSFWASYAKPNSFRQGKREYSHWVLSISAFFQEGPDFILIHNKSKFWNFYCSPKILMFCRYSYTSPAVIALQIHAYLKNADDRITPFGICNSYKVLLNLCGLLGDI